MPAPRGDALPDDRPLLDAGQVYDAYAGFVWGSLYRLGVATSDLPDMTQEVFAVVHRRRDVYDPAEPIRPWLWGICLGLVRNYRRRSFRHRERLRAEPPEVVGTDSPEAALEERRARERGEQALAALDPDKRAVFVMFEVEGLSGKEIAEQLGVPVGTVHSRLFAARKELSASLKGEDR